jgi:hypothetical protein
MVDNNNSKNGVTTSTGVLFVLHATNRYAFMSGLVAVSAIQTTSVPGMTYLYAAPTNSGCHAMMINAYSTCATRRFYDVSNIGFS